MATQLRGNSGDPDAPNFLGGNFDMSLLKERPRLEFRFEFFNIFNHDNFNNPGGKITSDPSNFGLGN
jgi:hypothetical protein